MLYQHQIRQKLQTLLAETENQGRLSRHPVFVIRLNSPVHRIKMMKMASELIKDKGLNSHEFRFTSGEALMEQLLREAQSPQGSTANLFLVNSFDEATRTEQIEIRIALLFENFMHDAAKLPAPIFLWMPTFMVDILYRRSPFFWKAIGGKITDCTDQSDIERAILEQHDTYERLEQRQKRIATLEAQLEEAREKIEIIPSETISLMRMLSQHYFEDRQYEKAYEVYSEVLAYFSAINDKSEKAAVLYQIGIILQVWGCYDQALHHYREAHSIYGELGNQVAHADITQQLGRLYQDLGEFDLAIDHYNHAIEENKSAGRFERIANTILRLGTVYEEIGIFNKAVEKYRESFELSKQHTNYRRMGIALLFTGRIYEEKALYKEAVKYLFAAKSIFEKISIPHRDVVETSLKHIEDTVGSEPFARFVEEARKQPNGKKG